MKIADLLNLTVERGASDLHLTAGLPPLVRIDGEISPLFAEPMVGLGGSGDSISQHQALALLHEVMREDQRQEFEDRLEADFSYELAGVARFRVNAFHQNRGVAAVFRSIPSKTVTMEAIGLGPIFKTIADSPRGLVIATGPTGSGKSTTLAALIDYLNKTKSQHILTIEDPIEFVHESKRCLINQREVHRDTHSFSNALRSALREDPDIIMVGELRDLETIRLALTAAETGHLVFATLHTTSAAKTIDRVIDVFPAGEKDMVRSMLSESLQAVVSQVLLRKEGGGRVAAFEIMRGTPAIRNLIREDKVAQMYSTIQTGASQGMVTLDQSLKVLVDQGLVHADVARAKAKSPDNF
ncbi:MAG: type IV pilus twitching motility protein PilT [Pseudomonadales bacterium]|jgi:twitching motility protein PilT|nr:type IV pilus twitching motility protein PilT [Pseudomonadales bacterium]MBL6804448.1 type IV pilus twitching motility protein PilT [Pseudomonadales bacterium]